MLKNLLSTFALLSIELTKSFIFLFSQVTLNRAQSYTTAKFPNVLIEKLVLRRTADFIHYTFINMNFAWNKLMARK